jgi:ElaB/YqjD/DUF883 family membrane-anchored ribosome-binding protein
MNKTIERTKGGMDALIDRASDGVVSLADQAQDGIDTAAGRVVENAHLTGDYVRDGAETASRRAHQRVTGAAKTLDHALGRAQGDLSRATAKATDYVSENPGRSLAVAASGGFLLGMLVGWRRSS